jgi:hypothetical protein
MIDSHKQLLDLCIESYSSKDAEIHDIEMLIEKNRIGEYTVALRGTNEARDIITDIRLFPAYIKRVGFVPVGYWKVSKKIAKDKLP